MIRGLTLFFVITIRALQANAQIPVTTPPPTPTPIPTVVPVAPVQAATTTTIVLDSFDSVSQWTTTPADGVEISVHPESSGLHGRSMRVDFDFHGHGGYAVIHRPLL